VELDLSHNQLSGSIPPFLNNLVQLSILWLSNNELKGAIPSFLGNFPELVVLGLDGNKFTGELPLSIGNLTNLQLLQIHGNSLSGFIPDSLSYVPYISADCLPGNDNLVECSFCDVCCGETQCCSDEFGFCVGLQ